MSAWPTIPLSETGTWLSGGTPARKNESYWNGTIPWIGTKDLKGFDLLDASEHITETAAEDGARIVEPGAVLFVTRGMSLAKEFRVGVSGVRLSFNQDVKAIVPRHDLDPRFLAWFLVASEQEVLGRVDTASHGTKRLPLERIEGIDVPIPPLPEQRRIAAILDETDALCRKRREALGLLDELLRSAFLEMFGDIPAGRSPWPWGTCADATTMSSGKSSKAVLSREPTDVPVYGGNGVNGYATEALFDEPVIVVGRVGQQCGITHLTSGPSWVTDNAIVVRVTDSSRFDPVYLATAFQHAPIRDTVTRLDLPFINQDMLRELAIPLPPIDVQRRYVALRAAAQEEAARAEAALLGVSGLFEALLHRAFTGVL